MSEQTKPMDDQRYGRIMRLRKIGMAVSAAGMLYIAVPMLIGAYGGLARGEVWDPYTGRSLDEQAEVDSGCLREAESLIADAGATTKMTRAWEQDTRRWVVRCREGFPTVYQMLMDTRERLRSGEMGEAELTESPEG